MADGEKTREQLADETLELRNRLATVKVREAERNRVEETLIRTQLRLRYLLCSSPAVI